MKKMNYQEFKNEVMANIKDYLTEEYKDYEMIVQTITKSSGEYEGLMIGPKDRHLSVIPALNLNNAYEKYEEGMPFDEVMDKLADIRMNISLPDFNAADIFDYNKIKDQIFPRLINTSANTDYLADKPHKEIEDLSLIYAVRVCEDSQGFAEAVITDELADMWGVDGQELHDRAMENIAERPPVFQNIENVLFGETEDIEIEDVDPENYRIPYFILTNQQKTKGAVMAVNPKTMDRIASHLGDVYVIPSSVDETLIVPKSAVEDVQPLIDMVRQVNTNEVRPEDQLSNNVYEYSAETHTLKIVGDGQPLVESDYETDEDMEGPDINM